MAANRYRKIDNDSVFYCINCATKGIPVIRSKSQLRGSGHMKALYCLNCKAEVNHYECRTMEDVFDFKQMFDAGVFKELAQESIEFREKEAFNV